MNCLIDCSQSISEVNELWIINFSCSQTLYSNFIVWLFSSLPASLRAAGIVMPIIPLGAAFGRACANPVLFSCHTFLQSSGSY